MQANRNIHLCQEKAPIYKLSPSKTPKNNKLVVTDTRQKTVEIVTGTARAPTLAPAIILRTWVFLQKFPFLQDP